LVEEFHGSDAFIKDRPAARKIELKKYPAATPGSLADCACNDDSEWATQLAAVSPLK
jgi:hypothetical protein